MTCAGCDPADCPADAWHLHVTVKPPKEWRLVDVQRALEQDITRIGMKPIVVTNHFRDGRAPYKELIPTKHVRGSEADAAREIFHMGVQLNNSGWRVKRLKIEGDASKASVANRAIYYETHLKSLTPDSPLVVKERLPLSTNAKGDRIYTMRRYVLAQIQIALLGMDYRTEAAVLDTAPELDSEWMNQ